MDSGNSGSMSSSGEEEYDSRSDMVAPLLNINNPHPPPPHQFPPFPFLPPPPPPPHQTQSSLHRHAPPTFDIPSNDHLINWNNPTPFLNPPPDHPDPSQPFIDNPAAPAKLNTTSLHNDNNDPPPPPSTASKKRSRASRRAPTTVLTTDTSNFRAMVQEFTGVPSPPFSSSSSSSYSRRLHLLTTPHHPPFPPPPSTFIFHNNNHVPPSSSLLSLNYPTETVASYNDPPQNTLPFQPPSLHSFNDPHVAFPGNSTHPNSSMPSSSIEDQLGIMNNVPPHVPASEPHRHDIGGSANQDHITSFHVHLNSSSAADNNSTAAATSRGESWICSSD